MGGWGGTGSAAPGRGQGVFWGGGRGRSCGQSTAGCGAVRAAHVKDQSRAAPPGTSSCRKAGHQLGRRHLLLFQRHCPHTPTGSWQRETCAMLTHTMCVLLPLFDAGTPAARASSTSWVWRQCWAALATQHTQVGFFARGGGLLRVSSWIAGNSSKPRGPGRTIKDSAWAGPKRVLGAVGIGLGETDSLGCWASAAAAAPLKNSSRSSTMAGRLSLDPVLTADAAAVVNLPAQAAPGSTCSTWAASLRQR